MSKFQSKAILICTVLTAYAIAGCSGGGTGSNTGSSPNTEAGGGGGNTVKIVSSLPMTGSSVGLTQTIVNGIKQAVDEAKSTAC
ncbi:MAG TPA: hypothetical protein V6D12_01680, partial [Candidatus Obscuribacterales bacterium]